MIKIIGYLKYFDILKQLLLDNSWVYQLLIFVAERLWSAFGAVNECLVNKCLCKRCVSWKWVYFPIEEPMFLQVMKCVHKSQPREHWLLLVGYNWKLRFLKVNNSNWAKNKLCGFGNKCCKLWQYILKGTEFKLF